MVRRPRRFGERRYKDHRDWSKYNEELIIRKTFFFDFGFKEGWDKELDGMNKGKKGGQYRFPDSFIRWLTAWHQLLDYRGLESMARKLAEYGVIPYFEDFTTAWYRIHDLVPVVILPQYKDLNISTDGTGMRAGNSGRYLEMKYGKKGRDRYVVVTITVDAKHKKLLAIDAHIEGKGPSEPNTAIEQGKGLMKGGFDIKKFNGDGKYDTNDTFEFWGNNRVKVAIPPRINAKIRQTKSKHRRREIRQYRKWGYKKWRKERRYGDRLAAECENSCVKREFGESLASKIDISLCAEAVQKFWVYDMLKDFGAGRI